jgi:predicted GH43/DUF377 family glycosyl hydrolase
MLQRYEGNPILRPNSKNWWETAAIFNPAACLKDGKIHLFPRVVGEYKNYISRIGHYISDDGINFELASPGPIFGPGKNYDRWACEDPRVTEIEGTYYFTYVALSKPAHKGGGPPATALISTKNFQKFYRCGLITSRISDNKDVVLFPEKINGKYVMLHRPSRWCREWFDNNENRQLKRRVSAEIACLSYKYENLPQKAAIWIAYSRDRKHWGGHKVLMEPQYWWEEIKIGGGTPPIKTEVGWLIIYHGVARGCYRAGAALLDLGDPSKVIGRTREPILEPTQEYETRGDVNNVVFPEGSVVIDGRLFVYYGAADKYVGLATCFLNTLLKKLRK